MKLVELGLTPFGPFSDLKLDLSAPAGLHVVFGPNEAGKSTTLRAITGLLYGIPHETSDAHRYRMPELRIAGRLQRADGSVLDVVRRKGIKNTLLDREGRPIDDLVLSRALGGVNEDLFRAMFGLDHSTLRHGAAALLRGRGDLGETLFDAGVGGAAVGEVLEELERGASELFLPRGKNQRINRGLKELGEKRRLAREAITDPAAFEQQTQGLEAAKRELAQLESERHELRAERARLERIRRTLPKLRERRELRAERATIDGPLLAPELSERRESLQRERDGLVVAAERLRRDLDGDTERRATLTYSERLAALDEDRCKELFSRRAVHLRAASDLPKRRAELKGVEAEARAILNQLGVSDSLETAEKLRITVPTQARIRELARAHATMTRMLTDAERELALSRAELRAVHDSEPSLPRPRDVAVVAAELARVQRAGDLERRVQQARSELSSAADKANAGAAALALEIPLARISSLPVPDPATVERFEHELVELGRSREATQQSLAELGEHLARLQRERAELSAGGRVPSVSLLEQARLDRDAGWQLIRRAWLESTDVAEQARAWDPTAPLDRAFERALERADDAADELRRDADRVARASTIDSGLEELGRRRSACLARLSEIDAAREVLDADWRRAWEPSGVTPRTPREMRAWLEKLARLQTSIEAWDGSRRALDQSEALLAEHREALARALRAAGDAVAVDASLETLIELARAAIEREARDRAEREEHERARRSLDKSIAAHEARAEHARRELGGWTTEWEQAVAALTVDRTPTPEEVTSRLDLHDQLFRALERVSSTRHRIDTMERDAEEFARDVAALVSVHAPELAERTAESAAEVLVREHGEMRQIARARAELDVRISDKRRELAEIEIQLGRSEAELGAILAEAGVGSLGELVEAEARSRRAREIDAQLSALDQALADDRAGRSLQELEDEIRDVDMDQAKLRLVEIDEALEVLHEQAGDARDRMQSAKHGLDLFGHSTAVQAEQDAQALAAELFDHTERYVRLRLAAIVLRREIERYRERHQGPVVARASELYRRLTRGSFSGLRADVDSKGDPVLSCVRADGTLVQVGGLSEGSSEQLYLALRLASLEHYGEHNELLPLVLDDVLIHSDQERTLAALELFGELGERMQILLFSHHAHLVDLARKAVPARRLAVHELEAGLSVRE